MTKKAPALFLDRDGTINTNIDYIHSPDLIELIPGSALAIIKAKNAGFRIVVISNQSGVARGLIEKENLPLINKRVEELVAKEASISDFKFDDIRMCLHHPQDGCSCRKPETQMVEESVSRLNLDKSRSYFIGDKTSDILCGDRSGIMPFLVLTGHGLESRAALANITLKQPLQTVPDLAHAVELILSMKTTSC